MPKRESEKQTLDKESLELVFNKALKVPALTQGLLYIVPRLFKKKTQDDDFLSWCINIVKTTLRAGLHDLDYI
jgi:hypothetical protein